MTTYTNTGPVDCSVQPDLSKVKGKSAIVTGGEHLSIETLCRTGSDAGQDPRELGKDMLKHL